jgi:hypothetical protein
MIYSLGENDINGRENENVIKAANKAYRTVFPTYNLGSTTSIGAYQTFSHGNSLFIITDASSFINKQTIFGSTQLNWIKSVLTAATQDSSVKAIFITFSQPWNYVAIAYDWDMIKQNYDSLLADVMQEKVDTGDILRKNLNFNRPNEPNFKSVMMLIGQPSLAFDEGTWNNYGNFPIAVCGPMYYWQQCRGGPYSHGSFHDSQSQYCSVNVYHKPSGNACIVVKGIIPKSEKKSSTEQTVFLYDTCEPDKYRGRINIKCPIDWKEKILNAGITLASIIFVFVIFFIVIQKIGLRTLSYSTIKED